MKKEDLQKILDDLAYGDKYGEVLRAKGMVPSEEKAYGCILIWFRSRLRSVREHRILPERCA